METARRLELATASASLGVWDWNVKDNAMFWDDQMLNLYGYNRQTFPGGIEAWQEGLHPDDREATWEASQSALRGDCDWNHEFRIRRPDGVVRWIKANGEVIRDQDGSPVRMLGINRDITDRKETEQQLREKEFFFRESQQAAMVGSYKCDFIAGKWESTEVLDSIFGIDADYDRSIQGWLNIVHPDDRDMMDRYLMEEVIANRNTFSREYRIIRQNDGETRWVNGRGAGEIDSDGNLIFLMGTIQDMTERKLAEIELRETKARLQAAMDCSPAGIAIADAPDGKLRYVNDTGLLIRGADRQSVVNGVGIDEYVKRWMLFDLDGRELGMEEVPLARAIMFGETNSRELIIRRAEGDEHIVLANAAPIKDESGNVKAGVVVFTDITERRRIENEKKQLESQLYQSQKMEAVGLLAGGVAHDFNNILTVIGGYSSLLQLDDSLSDVQKKSVAEIESSVEKAAQLTHGLLAFSRKQPLIMKHENLNDIVQHVHKFLARIIGEDITLQSACFGAELPIVADRGQIEQVLINLATNARDAMSGGGVFTVKSDHTVLDSSFTDFHKYNVFPGHYALLTVSDTGTGISKEHIAHIFEPFFTTKEVGKGTGLGMAIIYGIIKQHNGFINVYSEPGHGTTFRIYLPIDEKSNGFHTIKTESVPPAGGNETILVAEDEPNVRALVSNVLQSHGYTVVLAEDGVDAVDKFKTHQNTIRLILMDLIMPRKNGKDAYEEISRIKPGVKLLFSSGYTADFIESRGVSEENVELIMKPVRPMELLRKIREMLDN
jgi:PAS domain S-box-containing protein